jgi:hypothetical protein
LVKGKEEEFFKGLDIFKRQKYRTFWHTSANSNFTSWKSHQLALGGCSALHQQSTERNMGFDLILGSIPLLLQLNFDLLFLVYLILVFRILELFCNAIKLRIEDELGVRFWVLHAATVRETYSYYMKNCKLPSVVLSDFSFLFSDIL